MESIKQLADNRDKLKSILISLISDIEDMKTTAPEEEEEKSHWFGWFSVGDLDRQDYTYAIQWPNLSILLEEAKKAVK